MTTTAQDRGWGPSYPSHCAEARAKCETVEAAGCSWIVRSEVAGLIVALVTAWHRTVEALDPAQCWSLACRAVRGGTAPSNHSWGLAVDLNSAKHPRLARGTFSASQVRAIRALLARPEFRNFRWGGDFSPEKIDEHHVEYLGTPADAIADSRLLGGVQEEDMPLSDDDLAKVARLIDARVDQAEAKIIEKMNSQYALLNYGANDPAATGTDAKHVGTLELMKAVEEVRAAVQSGGSGGGDLSGGYDLTVTRKP